MVTNWFLGGLPQDWWSEVQVEWSCEEYHFIQESRKCEFSLLPTCNGLGMKSDVHSYEILGKVLDYST